eukprot:TRINITY_DN700_c4_g1_i1.p1 TRINITY_DN700_c4_g1~~TRINITY_DN700_c4_g1_i1.p1  ORF type:complete len:879 (-),score=189.26 TRINITY_DN700_c4_g1_i1:62-2698(-)
MTSRGVTTGLACKVELDDADAPEAAKLARGDRELEAGDVDEALATFRALDAAGPLADSALIAARIGRCRIYLGETRAALRIATELLQRDGSDVDAQLLLAEAQFQSIDAFIDSDGWSKAAELAVLTTRKALRGDPEHAMAAKLLRRLRAHVKLATEAREASILGDYERVEDCLTAALGNENIPNGGASAASTTPSPPQRPLGRFAARCYVARAFARLELGKLEGCVADSANALKRDSRLAAASLLMADSLQKLERWDEAVSALQALYDWNREEDVFWKLEWAKFHVRRVCRPDYYQILGLDAKVAPSQAEVKRNYLRLSVEYHPDKVISRDPNADPFAAEAKFKEIGEAYEFLGTPAKRELYDKGYDAQGIREVLAVRKSHSGGAELQGATVPPEASPAASTKSAGARASTAGMQQTSTTPNASVSPPEATLPSAAPAATAAMSNEKLPPAASTVETPAPFLPPTASATSTVGAPLQSLYPPTARASADAVRQVLSAEGNPATSLAEVPLSQAPQSSARAASITVVPPDSPRSAPAAPVAVLSPPSRAPRVPWTWSWSLSGAFGCGDPPPFKAPPAAAWTDAATPAISSDTAKLNAVSGPERASETPVMECPLPNTASGPSKILQATQEEFGQSTAESVPCGTSPSFTSASPAMQFPPPATTNIIGVVDVAANLRSPRSTTANSPKDVTLGSQSLPSTLPPATSSPPPTPTSQVWVGPQSETPELQPSQSVPSPPSMLTAGNTTAADCSTSFSLPATLSPPPTRRNGVEVLSVAQLPREVSLPPTTQSDVPKIVSDPFSTSVASASSVAPSLVATETVSRMKLAPQAHVPAETSEVGQKSETEAVPNRAALSMPTNSNAEERLAEEEEEEEEIFEIAD